MIKKYESFEKSVCERYNITQEEYKEVARKARNKCYFLHYCDIPEVEEDCRFFRRLILEILDTDL